MNILFAISTEQSIVNPIMGSERQFVGYANALYKMGHSVTMVNVLKTAPPSNIKFDICHMVNASGLKGPYMLMASLCHKNNIPVVFSPVYWPTDELQDVILATSEYTEQEIKSIKEGFEDHIDGIKQIIPLIDLLAPNSAQEGDVVLNMAGMHPGDIPVEVVPNGIPYKNEIAVAEHEPLEVSEHLEKLLRDKFVLSVGRIEVRKNQLQTARAMDIVWEKYPDMQFVMMGTKGTKRYMTKLYDVLENKPGLVIPPGPPLAVYKMMLRSEIHVMPSYIETPGLVNLEAAALGKPIVVADRGSVREYFGDTPGVFYCDPNDYIDIADKIISALEFRDTSALSKLVINKYSYDRVAERLIEVYNKLLT